MFFFDPGFWRISIVQLGLGGGQQIGFAVFNAFAPSNFGIRPERRSKPIANDAVIYLNQR
jgi:hypothetical protein